MLNQPVKKQLKDVICRNMLFIHAILGCDTTSSVFGIGKGLALKKIKLPHFTKQAEVFQQPNRSKDEIASAGEAALVCIYGGLQDEELNHLRYRFCICRAKKPPTNF